MTRGKTTTEPTERARGWVSFVGSGPGDPDLMTLRAVELLRQAEVVVTESPEHEELVSRLLGTEVGGGEPGTPEVVDGGFGEDGQPLDFIVEDFDAIVMQHECDHLDGVLYVDRCDTKTLAFLDEYRRWGPLDEIFEIPPGEGLTIIDEQ